MKYVLIFIILVFSAKSLMSQETVVPLDTAGKIMMLDKDLCQKFNLYTEYPNIKEVFIFKIADNEYSLEITYEENSLRKKKKEKLDNAQYMKYITDLSEKVYKNEGAELGLQKSGRVEFILSTVTYSLGIWGWSVPVIVDPSSSSTYSGLYLLSAGAGFLTAYAATSNSYITEGMARFSSYGGGLGYWHGFNISFALFNDFDKPSNFLIPAVVGSVGELIANYQIAKNNKFSLGKADAIGTYATLGAAAGPILYGTFGLYQNNDDNFLRNFGIVNLLTSAGGYIIGNYMTYGDNYYYDGDASLLSNSALIGAALPISILVAMEYDFDSPELPFGTVLAGGIAGTLIGDLLAKKINITSTQGLYLGLATSGGALLGAGISLLTDNYRIMPLLTTVGAFIGMGAMVNSFWDNALDKKYSNSNWDYDFNFAGLMSWYQKSEIGTPNINSRYDMRVPIFDLKYTFR